MVRTPPFHGGNMGSNPVGVTKNTRCTSVYRVFFMTTRDEPAAVNDEERVNTKKETERREARQVRGGEAAKGAKRPPSRRKKINQHWYNFKFIIDVLDLCGAANYYFIFEIINQFLRIWIYLEKFAFLWYNQMQVFVLYGKRLDLRIKQFSSQVAVNAELA